MSEPDTDECSNCGNVILRDPHSFGPQVYEFVLPVDVEAENVTYETHSYRLCVDCRREIVDWIEGVDESAPRVDATDLRSFSHSMRDAADDLHSAADTVEQMLRSDDRHGHDHRDDD